MFRLRVLGGFVLEGPSEAEAPQLPKRRAEAVLAVLAVSGELGCTRERLLALLWPERDEAQARHGLRDALHAMRRALAPGVVTSSGSLLRLDPTVVTADVLSFSDAVARGRHEEVVQLYRGPLLDGFHVDEAAEFEHWLDGERTRLAREYGAALKHLAAAAERVEAWDEAAGWWARTVEHDPLNSHLVLQLVHALAAIGDRASAIKTADTHARRLRAELDLEPDREILARIERIRRGELPVPRGAMPTVTHPVQVEQAVTVEELVTPRRMPRGLLWAAGITVLVLGAVLGARAVLRTPPAETVAPRTAVAVLPFRNLSADSSNAYFAAGLHDELLTQLNRVASLRVVGRTSISGYQETSKPLRQIGEELGVGSIVEASVQVVGNRLRVTVQLLDPVTQTALWAEGYDRALGDAFTVQSDIAQRIVAAVGATLTSTQAGALAGSSTKNSEAYQLYLQGLDYRRRPGLLRQNLEIAQQLFERALGLDSDFAQAHADLSVVHWAMYGLEYDPSPTRLERASREADRALHLAPDLPKGHFARGLALFVGRGNSREALNEFNLGLRSAPNDADLWAWVGVANRTLGSWDSAIVAFDRAQSLDPRNANLLHSIGDTYHYLHRYREAIETYRHALAFAPDVAQTRLSIAWSYILWKGELDTLRAVLQSLPLEADPGMGGWSVGTSRLGLLLLERRPDSMLALVRAMRPPASESTVPPWSFSYWYWTESAYSLRGDTAAARAVLESALVVLTAQVRARLDEYDSHSARGAVLAKLGRRGEALREEHWLAQADEHRRNNYGDAGEGRATILMLVGEPEAALTQLERALSGPSLTSVPYLRLAPAWDPIRNDPRFQALLRKYAVDIATKR